MVVIIKAGPGDNTDQVIKRFKKKILQDDILTEIRDRERYKKPSIIKKEKKKEIERRRKRSRT